LKKALESYFGISGSLSGGVLGVGSGLSLGGSTSLGGYSGLGSMSQGSGLGNISNQATYGSS